MFAWSVIIILSEIVQNAIYLVGILFVYDMPLYLLHVFMYMYSNCQVKIQIYVGTHITICVSFHNHMWQRYY